VVYIYLHCFIPQVSAGDYPCPPNLGAVTIGGNVVVKGTCILNGTTVDGNVKLKTGADLLAIGAMIEGNLQNEEPGVQRMHLHCKLNGEYQPQALISCKKKADTLACLFNNSNTTLTYFLRLKSTLTPTASTDVSSPAATVVLVLLEVCGALTKP